MFGIWPSIATTRYGLSMRTGATPPLWPMARVPLSVSVRRFVPVLLKVGRPANVRSLPTARSLLSTKSVVPAAKLAEPAPSGPDARPLPPCWGMLLLASTMPPEVTVRPPVKEFWPPSWRRPFPILVTETPSPMILAPTASVGVSSA